VITAACTVSDLGISKTFARGHVLEASASLVAALGANARAVTSAAGGRTPSRDDTGEPVGVSNGLREPARLRRHDQRAARAADGKRPRISECPRQEDHPRALG
jgi:hypothetical protein